MKKVTRKTRNEDKIKKLKADINNLKNDISAYEKERPTLIENSKKPEQNKKKMAQLEAEIKQLKTDLENYIKTNEKTEKDMQENNEKNAENNARQKEEIKILLKI